MEDIQIKQTLLVCEFERFRIQKNSSSVGDLKLKQRLRIEVTKNLQLRQHQLRMLIDYYP